jgi:hypothetical protein
MNAEKKIADLGRGLAEFDRQINQLEVSINSGIQIIEGRNMNMEEAIINLERILAEFDQQIAQLEASINKGHKNLEKEFHSHLEAIRQRRRYVEERLGRAQLVKAESWWDEDFRAGILTIFDDIGRRINSFFNHANHAK